jgi:hypothetical protein
MSARITARLHERLHKLPGMPPHPDAGRLNHNPSARRLSAHNRGRHPSLSGRHPALRHPNGRDARPPLALVAWQEWIGGLFTGRRGRA